MVSFTVRFTFAPEDREEIARAQLNYVKELLAGTDLTLSDIAERAGFQHTEYLSVMFKREVGMTAGDYRIQNNGGPVTGPRGLRKISG